MMLSPLGTSQHSATLSRSLIMFLFISQITSLGVVSLNFDICNNI